MIVWSRGLGKQRLPLALADATMQVKPGQIWMEGEIEPVCWNYAIKLGPSDLRDFLRLMAQPDTAAFLAERGGVLAPFLLKLIAVAPGLLVGIVVQKVAAAFRPKTKAGAKA